MPAFTWAVFIMVLCTGTTGGFISENFLGIGTDKWGHAFIFSVFVFFLMQGLIKTWRFSFLLPKIRFIAVLISIAYAGIVELVQHFFTSGRIADINDFIADIIGSLLGWLMFYTVYGNLKFLDK